MNICTDTIRHEARQIEIGLSAHPTHTASLLRECADEIDCLRDEDDAVVLRLSGGSMADFKHGVIYHDKPLPRWKRVLMTLPYFRRRFTPIVAFWQTDDEGDK